MVKVNGLYIDCVIIHRLNIIPQVSRILNLPFSRFVAYDGLEFDLVETWNLQEGNKIKIFVDGCSIPETLNQIIRFISSQSNVEDS